MPPNVPQHIVEDKDGVSLALDVDEFDGLPFEEADGTLLSLTLTEA